MDGNRREFCGLALLGGMGLLQRAAAQEAVGTPGQPLPSFALNFAELTAQDHGTSTFRPICDGITAVGARLEVHETTLQPGAEPHPPHRHKHEEFLVMVRGRVEVTVEGKTTVLTPGAVSFWKSNDLHHARNVGSEVAQYVVVSVGAD